MDSQGRPYCADRPDGIAHLVDSPRAQRCDQHRLQRHRWSDANAYRARNGKPPKAWDPEPLTAERRRAAQLLHEDLHAALIDRAVTGILFSVDQVQAKFRPNPQSTAYLAIIDHLARIRAHCATLTALGADTGPAL